MIHENSTANIMKKIIRYGLSGACTSLIALTIITVIVSLYVGTGEFYFVNIPFITLCGSEIKAVIIQLILCSIAGFIVGSTALIFDIEVLGTIFQTIIHYTIAIVLFVGLSWICYWGYHTVSNVLFQMAFCSLFYLFEWLYGYFSYRSKIKKINLQINQK